MDKIIITLRQFHCAREHGLQAHIILAAVDYPVAAGYHISVVVGGVAKHNFDTRQFVLKKNFKSLCLAPVLDISRGKSVKFLLAVIYPVACV